MIDVLDHGYIRLVNTMGSDIDVVNAARVSYDKQVEILETNDIKLIEYLIKNKHDSTLRHCAMTFEIYAPLMVARQWYKHAVASSHLDDQMGWNESSRRYVTENEQFYCPMPDQWRAAPENKKQGSADAIDTSIGAKYHAQMIRIIRDAHELYKEALADGVAPEQARLLLPAYAMYVRWRWTASLHALLHFISLRQHSHAQYEIQQYADAVAYEVDRAFPITTDKWRTFRELNI